MSTSALARLPASGAADLLYVLYHDVGADAAQMTVLAQRLAGEYPQAAVLCVHAPEVFDGGDGRDGAASDALGAATARQWFSVRDLNARPTNAAAHADTHAAATALLGARVGAALPHFIAVLRGLQQRFGIGWERTALAGFGLDQFQTLFEQALLVVGRRMVSAVRTCAVTGGPRCQNRGDVHYCARNRCTC